MSTCDTQRKQRKKKQKTNKQKQKTTPPKKLKKQMDRYCKQNIYYKELCK